MPLSIHLSRQPGLLHSAQSLLGIIGTPQDDKSNIDTHKKEIMWTALSKTFQDAITTTQELGIRYLWIDSICILQDDKEDWEVQSG